MPSKRQILEQLKRQELQANLDHYELEVADKRKAEQLVDALASSKKARLVDILSGLGRSRLKEICRALNIDYGGKKIADIVARLVGDDGQQLALSSSKPAKKKAPAPSSYDSPRIVEPYEHKDKTRLNNPPVGLVTPETEREPEKKKVYQYDPHLDPQLVWAGKAEHTSFEVPTVSLHVHERVDPMTIIDAARAQPQQAQGPQQFGLFETPRENPPFREAVDFYKHEHGWSNRLIAGDSLLVMNSLLEKEGMAGKVQMVYVDPPYGIPRCQSSCRLIV
jgi:hypothetical protein